VQHVDSYGPKHVTFTVDIIKRLCLTIRYLCHY